MSRSIFIFFLFFSFNIANSSAGPRVNNGGGAWACVDQSRSKIQWIEILDLSSFIGKAQIASEKDEWQIYEEKLNLIKEKIPRLQKILEQAPINIKKHIFFLNHPLEVVADAALSTKPLPTTCRQGHIQYVQVADFLVTGQLALDKAVWENKVFSNRSKAALLLHEHLYFAFRNVLRDESSFRTQKIVEALFQGDFDEMILKTIQKNLDLDQNIWGWMTEKVVNLSPVDLTCQVLVLNATTMSPISRKYYEHIPYGAKVSEKFGDFSVTVETNAQDGAPQFMKVQHDLSGFSAHIEGENSATLFYRNRRVSVSLVNEAKNFHVEWSCRNEISAEHLPR